MPQTQKNPLEDDPHESLGARCCNGVTTLAVVCREAARYAWAHRRTTAVIRTDSSAA